MTRIREDQLLDCKGLNCPLPVLKTKKVLDGMERGEILKMVATDPGSVKDIQGWTARTNNRLLESNSNGVVYAFYILKA